MSLVRAKYDWLRFSTAGGFQVAMALISPAGVTTQIVGLATKHNNSVTTDGIPVNAKNVHISLIESYLVSLGLTVRNTNGEINLRNYRVNFPDSSGVTKNYIIKETMPDETTGVIVCILGDYGS
jgi:hypothetical protein